MKRGGEVNKNKITIMVDHSILKRTRLAKECAKLDPKIEKALAEEGLREIIE